MDEKQISPLKTPVIICNELISGWRTYKTEENFHLQPTHFEVETTTMWSFPNRGFWATHTPHYRGNWSPQTVRNIILLYSKVNDLILDPMVGGGTTPLECMLTGRNSISVDINPNAVSLTCDRLSLPEVYKHQLPETIHKIFIGDTRKLTKIKDSTIDLLMVHPPYFNIIKYTNLDKDLSNIDTKNEFFDYFRQAIFEYYRVLKENSYCVVLMGDTRKNGHFIPLSTRMMIEFLDAGFILKEEIIKTEWNCRSDNSHYKYKNPNFLFIKHEHLFVFRKPTLKEKYANQGCGGLFA